MGYFKRRIHKGKAKIFEGIIDRCITHFEYFGVRVILLVIETIVVISQICSIIPLSNSCDLVTMFQIATVRVIKYL